MEDTYRTINAKSQGYFKDKGSKFIAFALPVTSEEEVKNRLEELRKEYHDARHHCYAYRIGFDGEEYRFNDDGEPSGTAGRPIFGQIRSNELTNILIVVVRYFGGTKLGKSGLIAAYKVSAADALDNSEKVTKVVQDFYEIKYDYAAMNDVMKIIKEENLQQHSQRFELTCQIVFSVRKKRVKKVVNDFSKIKNLELNYLRTE